MACNTENTHMKKKKKCMNTHAYCCISHETKLITFKLSNEEKVNRMLRLASK